MDEFEPRIRELLQAYPTMPTTVIAERVGWEQGLKVLKDAWAERAIKASQPNTRRTAG